MVICNPRNFISLQLRPDWNGKNSGPEFAFLYPDLTTALFGEWKDGVLVDGHPACLDGLTLQQGMVEPTFSLLTNDRQALSEGR